MKETDIKCSGCRKDIPKEGFDNKTQRPTWFATYTGCKITEWICVDCWDKGVRYIEYKNASIV